MNCPSCHHEHQGKSLAYICIGCPCPERPGAPADGAPTSIEDRIPKWFWGATDRVYDFPIRGAHWLTNGHMLLKLDGPARRALAFPGNLADAVRSTQVMLDAPADHAVRGFPYIARGDGSHVDDYSVEMQGVRFAFAYIALVEKVHPGCTWRVATTWGSHAHLRPAHAYVSEDLEDSARAVVGPGLVPRRSEKLVAVVMCQGTPEQVKAQRKAAAEGPWDAPTEEEPS